MHALRVSQPTVRMRGVAWRGKRDPGAEPLEENLLHGCRKKSKDGEAEEGKRKEGEMGFRSQSGAIKEYDGNKSL